MRSLYQDKSILPIIFITFIFIAFIFFSVLIEKRYFWECSFMVKIVNCIVGGCFYLNVSVCWQVIFVYWNIFNFFNLIIVYLRNWNDRGIILFFFCLLYRNRLKLFINSQLRLNIIWNLEIFVSFIFVLNHLLLNWCWPSRFRSQNIIEYTLIN